MNLFLSEYVGAFVKWLITGFKNKYSNELNGEGEHLHFFKQISIENENMILGLCTLLSVLLIIFVIFILLR